MRHCYCLIFLNIRVRALFRQKKPDGKRTKIGVDQRPNHDEENADQHENDQGSDAIVTLHSGRRHCQQGTIMGR